MKKSIEDYQPALTSHRDLIDKRSSVAPFDLGFGHAASIDPTREQIAELAMCLKHCRVITPILVDQDNNVIAGKAIALASIRLRCAHVAAYRAEDLSAAELETYARSLVRFAELINIDSAVMRDDVDRVRALANCIDDRGPIISDSVAFWAA